MSKIELPPGVEREEEKQPDVPSYKPRKNGNRAPGDPVRKAEEAIANLPSIMLAWDQGLQMVRMVFDPAEFKTWEMVEMVLVTALSQARFNLQVQRQQTVAMAMQQAVMEQQVKQQLLQQRR